MTDDFFEGPGGFSLPADAGITLLPFDRDNGLCAECEARSAFFEVRRPGEQSARRLCHACVFREFAPPRARALPAALTVSSGHTQPAARDTARVVPSVDAGTPLTRHPG